MQNVTYKVEGQKLLIEVDLSKTLGPSKTGKTLIIGTTAGNVEVKPGVKLGLNVYKKAA